MMLTEGRPSDGGAQAGRATLIGGGSCRGDGRARAGVDGEGSRSFYEFLQTRGMRKRGRGRSKTAGRREHTREEEDDSGGSDFNGRTARRERVTKGEDTTVLEGFYRRPRGGEKGAVRGNVAINACECVTQWGRRANGWGGVVGRRRDCLGGSKGRERKRDGEIQRDLIGVRRRVRACVKGGEGDDTRGPPIVT